jgi:hypothetical protein
VQRWCWWCGTLVWILSVVTRKCSHPQWWNEMCFFLEKNCHHCSNRIQLHFHKYLQENTNLNEYLWLSLTLTILARAAWANTRYVVVKTTQLFSRLSKQTLYSSKQLLILRCCCQQLLQILANMTAITAVAAAIAAVMVFKNAWKK